MNRRWTVCRVAAVAAARECRAILPCLAQAPEARAIRPAMRAARVSRPHRIRITTRTTTATKSEAWAGTTANSFLPGGEAPAAPSDTFATVAATLQRLPARSLRVIGHQPRRITFRRYCAGHLLWRHGFVAHFFELPFCFLDDCSLEIAECLRGGPGS